MSDSSNSDWLQHLLTEPLNQKELATYFVTSSKHVKALVEALPGVEQVGRRFRVPVRHMPPSYWIACGLLLPVEVEPDVRGHSQPAGTTPHTQPPGSDTRWS
jgi:hypothetical protein